VFRLVSKGALAEGVFKGETINTPSMLAVEDAIFALEWAQVGGGGKGLIARSDANAAALDKIVSTRDWLGHLAADEAIRSKTSVCLTVEGADEAFIKKFASLLEKEDAAYDVAGYRDAPAGPAHLVRRHRRHRRYRGARPVARLGLRRRPRPADLKALSSGEKLGRAQGRKLTFLSHQETLGSCSSQGPGSEQETKMPKVLISDKMDPKAAEIFRARGVEVDEITGKTPENSSRSSASMTASRSAARPR
jgi:hypothetical protein